MAATYLSFAATVVLQTVANGYRYGFDVMDATGLPSGTVYPALRRMEATGLIASRWEEPDIAQREQRPLRKYYELTSAGHHALGEAARRYRLVEDPTSGPVKPVAKRG
jgi:PadR family transcriptional regulator, regulatory protein PadR